MLKRAQGTKEKEIKTKKLKKEQSMGKVRTEIINKIIDNIGMLAEEAENLEDETDGIGDRIK